MGTHLALFLFPFAICTVFGLVFLIKWVDQILGPFFLLSWINIFLNEVILRWYIVQIVQMSGRGGESWPVAVSVSWGVVALWRCVELRGIPPW